MVRGFKQFFIVLSLVLFTQLAAFSPNVLASEVTVKIYPQQVMLGQPVTLVLTGEQVVRDFDKLDFSELKQQFVIYEVDSGSKQIRLQLYPLLAGPLTIPEIRAGAIHISATPVNVNPNPEVDIVWQSPKGQAYIGENLLWKATVSLKNAANQASFGEQPNPNWQVNYQAQAIAEQSQTGADAAGKTVILVANYQFTEVDAKRKQTIQSPVVVVKNTTNRLWLFFAAPQSVTIQSLPQFLPFNTTVGKVNLTTADDGFVKKTGDLNYWVWQLAGDGVDAFTLQNLAHELVAQLGHDVRLEWLSESREIESRFTEQGLHTVLTVRLPYRAVQAGLLDLPTVNLRYFDVESGKLVSQKITSRTQIALPVWLVWIGHWLLLMFSLALVYGVLLKIKQAWLNWQLRRAILNSKNAEELVTALFDWQEVQQLQTTLYSLGRLKLLGKRGAEEQGSGKVGRPATLQQFKESDQQRYGHSTALIAFITKLNQSLYAADLELKADQAVLINLAKRWLKERSIW